MEQMINIVISITSTICLSLMTNYIYDKLKSHSVRESGLEIKIKLKFFELNFNLKNSKK